MNSILFLIMFAVFINMIFTLLSIDAYARSTTIGEADYLALMFGASFISILSIIYIYTFSHLPELWKQIKGKKD